MSQQIYRRQVEHILRECDPNNVNLADPLLERYRGREAEVVEALKKKYNYTGPLPTSPTSGGTASWVEPATTEAATDTTAPTSAGSASPTAVESTAEASRAQSLRDEMTRIYRQYAPTKMHKLQEHLMVYKGREEELLEAVRKKYLPVAEESATASQPEAALRDSRDAVPSETPETDNSAAATQSPAAHPTATPAVATAPDSAASPAAETRGSSAPEEGEAVVKDYQYYRDRLENLYNHYCPDRVSAIDHLLEKYPGREEEVIRVAVRKYGPEPPMPPRRPQGQKDTTDEGTTGDVTFDKPEPNDTTQSEKEREDAASAQRRRAEEEEEAQRQREIEERNRRVAEEHLRREAEERERQQALLQAQREAIERQLAEHREQQKLEQERARRKREAEVEAEEERKKEEQRQEQEAHERYRRQQQDLEERERVEQQRQAELQRRRDEDEEEEKRRALEAERRQQREAEETMRQERERQEEEEERLRKQEEELQMRKQEEMERKRRELEERQRREAEEAERLAAQRALEEADQQRHLQQQRQLQKQKEEEELATCERARLEAERIAEEARRQLMLDLDALENEELSQRSSIEAEEDDAWCALLSDEESSRAATNRELSEWQKLRQDQSLYQPEFRDCFDCLGSTVVEGVEVTDADAARLIIGAICDTDGNDGSTAAAAVTRPLSQSGLYDLIFATLEAQPGCPREVLLAAVERAREFLERCYDTSRAPKGKSLVARELRFGFWVHRSVRPSVDGKWRRSWTVLDGTTLQLSYPNSTRTELSFSFSQVLRCKMESMLSTAAPRQYARNGIIFQLTQGPNPVEVLVCPEQVAHAQQLVKLFRAFEKRAKRDASLNSPNKRDDSSPRSRASGSATNSPRSRRLSVRSSPTHVDEVSLGLQDVLVYCCRSGHDVFAATLWSFAYGHLVHRPVALPATSSSSAADDSCWWDTSGVVDIVVTDSLPVKPPPPLTGKHSFMVRCHDGSSLFCCCETLAKRKCAIAVLRRSVLRASLQNRGDGASPTITLELPEALPGTTKKKESKHTPSKHTFRERSTSSQA